MSRRRVQCPSCASQSRDNSGNNLSLFPDDETKGYCQVCAKVVKANGDEMDRQRSSPQKDSSLELAAIANYPFRALEDRGISEETCRRFGVRVALDEETASIVTDHFYPYHNEEGETIGYKKRHLPKIFSTIGKPKLLFGQKQCKKNARMLCVFEGELDTLSAWEMLQQQGKNYNVVSLPNGANEAGIIDPQTRKELDFFTSHELVVICLDEDGPGRTTAIALAELLVSQCKIKIMRLNKKDSNEYLKAGDGAGWWNCLKNAKDYAPDAIENGSVADIEEMLTPITPGVFVDFLPNTMRKMYGLRPSEITMVLAPPGVGKTTLCRQITYDLLTKQSAPVFNMFLEEGKTKTRQGLLALHTGIGLNHLRRDPSKINREEVQFANDNILNRLELLTSSKVLLNDEALLNKINFFTKAKGCKFGVLDHISYVMASRDTKDERKEIDQLMTKLANLVEDQGLHLIIVSHIKRKNRDRDQSGNTRYPYWELLTLDDARGCVDKDTEFLSRDGWKPIEFYSEGDAVFIPDTDMKGKFVEDVAFVNLPCPDGFWSIKTNRIEMCLSGEHRIAHYTERDKENIKFTTAAEAVAIDVSNSTGFRGLIPTSLTATEENDSFPGGEIALRVQVMMNADGWVRNHKTLRSSVRVKKERKKDRARLLLSQYTNDWYEYAGGPGYSEFAFTPPKAKGFDSSYYSLKQSDLEIIVDELKYWDGEIATGRIGSTNKQDADFYQFVFTMTNQRANIAFEGRDRSFGGKYEAKDYYVVQPTTERFVSFRNCPNSKREIKKIESVDGRKYCFTTPTGMWLARKNGRVFVTGNSGAFEQLAHNIIGIEREVTDPSDDSKKPLTRTRILKSREEGILGIGDFLSYNTTKGALEPIQQGY